MIYIKKRPRAPRMKKTVSLWAFFDQRGVAVSFAFAAGIVV